MNDFVRERHRAFASVIDSDDVTELKKYSKKYGVPFPKSKKVAIAGTLKAVQYLTDFSEEEKVKAARKCISMGFNPFIRPYGYDREECEQ